MTFLFKLLSSSKEIRLSIKNQYLIEMKRRLLYLTKKFLYQIFVNDYILKTDYDKRLVGI